MPQTQTESYELPSLSDPKSVPDKKGFVRNVVHRLSQQTSRGARNSKNDEDATVISDTPSSDLARGVEDEEDVTADAERWNQPRANAFRVFATFFGFLVMGMNDAAYGAIIPYLETYYNLDYTVVSLIFLSPCVGYCSAAFINHSIHMRFGQRGVAFLSPFSKLVAYIVICTHPPYPALVVMYLLAGFGNGLQDGAWNAWIGAMADANQVLGFLHGFYGLGATISPFVATAMIVKADLPWYTFYYLMICMAAIELTTSFLSFYPRTGAVFRTTQPQAPTTTDSTDAATDSTPTKSTWRTNSRMYESLFTRPAARVTWLCALFLFGYVGAEVAIGGWVVSFMLTVRHGSRFASGMTETGFWLGVTVGRVVLGFVTPRIGEKLAIAIYLPLSLLTTLLFWLVPHFLASAIFVSFSGFFLGPMFPGAVVMATKLLPAHLHVSAVGFAAAFGGTGGAAFPFAVGAIAQRVGVKALQPVVLGILAVIWGLWLGLPRVGRWRGVGRDG